MNLDGFARFSNFDKWPNIDVALLKPEDIVRSVHVDEHVLLLKLYVLVFRSIVAKWSFRSTEVTPQH